MQNNAGKVEKTNVLEYLFGKSVGNINELVNSANMWWANKGEKLL